jgi:hypothetical protein
MNQQIDMDGNLHDLAPRCEQDRLFTADPQIRGQLNMPTDEPCSVCGWTGRPCGYCTVTLKEAR